MAKIYLNASNIKFLPRAEEFIETYRFDPDMLRAVVRNPQRIEHDPHAAEVDYPILRFIRGDLTVVVGLKTPDEPHVLFVKMRWPEEHHIKQGAQGASGGPARKDPTTVTQLKGWLQAEGCRFEPGGSGLRIYYGDAYVGSLHLTPHANGAALKNRYSHFKNRLRSVKAQQAIAESLKADGVAS